MTRDLADTVKGLAQKALGATMQSGTMDDRRRLDSVIKVFEPAIRELIAQEREACAKVVDDCNREGPYQAIGAARLIRARGGKS